MPGGARGFIDDKPRLRRPPPWRGLCRRLTAARTEEDAAEAIGALREPLELENLFVADMPLLPQHHDWYVHRKILGGMFIGTYWRRYPARGPAVPAIQENARDDSIQDQRNTRRHSSTKMVGEPTG